jgi:hypothetical protein
LLCRLHLETSGNSNASTYIKGRHRVCIIVWTSRSIIFSRTEITELASTSTGSVWNFFFFLEEKATNVRMTSYALQLDFAHHFQFDGKSKIRKSQFIRHSYVVRGTLSKIIRLEEKDLFRPRNLVLKLRSNKCHHRGKTIIFLDGERILCMIYKKVSCDLLYNYTKEINFVFLKFFFFLWIYRSLFCVFVAQLVGF